MVVIHGQSSRAAVVACGNGLVFLTLGAIVFLVQYRAVISTQLPHNDSGELRPLLALAIVTPIVIVFLIPVLASMLAAWRFAKLNAHVIMTHDGFQFPGIPGFRWARQIEWSDVVRMSVLAEASCSKEFGALLKLNKWILKSPVYLRIDLHAWNKRAGLRGLQGWSSTYNQSSSAPTYCWSRFSPTACLQSRR